MSMLKVARTIQCDVCGKTETEKQHGDGWPGWSSINGVALNGVAEPNLCTECTFFLMERIDARAETYKGDT